MTHRLRPLLLALTIAAGVTACGGGSDTPKNADITVVNTSPDSVYAGEAIVFSVTVTNEGPDVAADVGLAFHLAGAPAVGGITCTAVGGAACPDALGTTMTIPSLPVGGSLLLNFEVPGSADLVGSVTSSVVATEAIDGDTSNNTGESTTLSMDLRSGDYTVYASNGRQYTLSLDFNSGSWAMVGQQVDQSGTFTRDANGVDYVISGASRFRMGADDLIVGGFDFNLTGSNHPYDHGVRPFVASRQFTTDLAAMAGRSVNLVGINLRRNDLLESVVQPATFGSGVMQVCLAPSVIRVDACPANKLASYTLSVVNGEVKGVDTVHHDVIHFRMARSGGSTLLLRSEDAADDTGRQFRLGLAESTGLAGGSFAVSSTRGYWGATTLTDTHYAFSGTASDGATLDEAADLLPLGVNAPAGLRAGTRSTDAAPIILAQDAAIETMLGAKGGAAEGDLDIGLQ